MLFCISCECAGLWQTTDMKWQMEFPHAIKLLFLVVTVATYSSSAPVLRRKVCVQNDKNSCTGCDANISLHSISEFLEGINSSVGVDLILCSSVLMLQDTIQIQDRCSILIQSYVNYSRVICEGNHGGFKFINIADVTLKNFEVINYCGEEYEGNSTNITDNLSFLSSKSSVYFLNCSNVSITNVNITISDGTGLSIIDTCGNVIIENCTFEKNTVHENRFPGYGGLYTEFSYISAGKNCYYVIRNCTFKRKFEIFSVNEIMKYSAQEVFDVIPGDYFEFPLDLRDDLNKSVTTLYRKIFIMNSSFNSSISTANVYTLDKRVQIFGNSGDTAIIRVETIIDIGEVSFMMNVRMIPCPPGFILANIIVNENTKNRCDCSNDKIIVSCNNSIFRANIRIGNWIGYNNQNETGGVVDELQWGYCPIGYCKSNETNLLLLPANTNVDELDKLVCGNRTGRMCAYCRKNYSTYYHTNNFDCGPYDKCNIGWLLYIVSEIIPITVFFLVIILFNINFAAGTINGLIFYFQITEVSFQVTSNFVSCSPTLSHLNEVYTFFVGIFNLKFFYHSQLSFCLWREAQTLDLYAIRYVKIVYSLLLVFAIVFLLRCCSSRRMQWCVPTLFGRKIDVKSNIIHGLSGFLVLCYSECIRVSLLILTPARVHGHKENITVVYYNGNHKYFHGKHLAYALPALLFLIVFGLGPPLLLMSYPLCYRLFGLLKISESKFVNVLCKFIPLERFKPMYDAFQSSFKDEYRFYSGLYFIYRLINLIALPVTQNITDYYIVILIQFGVMSFLHAIAQPYKKRWHNVLDSFVFAYLLVIHVLILYNYRRARERLNRSHTISVVCTVLTPLYYLPLCIFIAVCVTRFIVKFRSLKLHRASSVFEKELSESLMNRQQTQ